MWRWECCINIRQYDVRCASIIRYFEKTSNLLTDNTNSFSILQNNYKTKSLHDIFNTLTHNSNLKQSTSKKQNTERCPIGRHDCSRQNLKTNVIEYLATGTPRRKTYWRGNVSMVVSHGFTQCRLEKWGFYCQLLLTVRKSVPTYVGYSQSWKW